MPITVKLCLEDEVRRVPLGGEGSRESYADLLEIISTTFPRTAGSTLSVTWIDMDGDTITMSTENEFQEALKCMSKGVPKFYVKARKVEGSPSLATNQSSPTPNLPTSSKAFSNETVHVDVECDECGMLPIIGVRYKSAFRADYDLCEKCERKLHPREPMIKLTSSVENTPSSPNLTNILHGTLDHAANALDCLLNSDETKRAWVVCNEKAVSPFVSAVDHLVSRWTRGASVPTSGGVAGSSDPASAATPSAAGSATTNAAPGPKPALKFIRDVSLPDGSEVLPGAVLHKEWLVCNDGKSSWPIGATLCTAGGDMLLLPTDTAPAAHTTEANPSRWVHANNANTGEVPTGPPISPPVLAGEERVLSVSLMAPVQPGRYVAYFRMKTTEGRRFGHRLWADIVVKAPVAACDAPVSLTPSSVTEEPPVRGPSDVDDVDVESTAAGHTAASIAIDTADLSPRSSPTPFASFTSAASSPHYAQFTAAPPLYWQQELSLLADMGFTEIDTLVPLLDKFVKTPATAGNSEPSVEDGANNNSTSEEKLRVAKGLQQVLAVLLGTRVTEVYI